jgi:predicted DNA-binding transcriptional regulator AlpA
MTHACSSLGASAVMPRVIFIETVAQLIGKAPTTIRTCATNAKYHHLIPRPWKMPGSRRLCWFEHEVVAWIESARPAPAPPLKRRRGRPTKVEQLQLEGLSWSEKLRIIQAKALRDLDQR